MTLTLYRNKGAQLTTAEADANMDHLGLSSNHTFTQSGSGAIAETVAELLRRFVFAYQFSTFAQAVTAAAGKTLIVSSSVSVSSNTTVPSTVTLKFERGGKLVPASGVTVTLNCPVEAGLWQIFDTSAGGTITATGMVVEARYPEWWGAVGDGTTDDNAALQAAWASCPAGGVVEHLGKTYKSNDNLTLPQVNNATLRGANRTGTTIQFATTKGVLNSGATRYSGLETYSLTINGAALGTGIGLDLNEVDRSVHYNLRVIGFATGIKVTSTVAKGAYHTTLYNPRLTSNTIGLHLTGAAGANQAHVYGGEISSNTTGVDGDTPTDGCEFIGTSFESNTQAIDWDGTRSAFIDIRLEGNTSDVKFGANSVYNVLRTGFFDPDKHSDLSSNNANYVELHGFATSVTEYKEMLESLDPRLGDDSVVCESANRGYYALIVPKRLFRATKISIVPTVSPGGVNIDVGIAPFGSTVIASSGSTALGSINTIQDLNLSSPVWLIPGRRYYLILAFDSATGSPAVAGSVPSTANAVAARNDSRVGHKDTVFPLSGTSSSGLSTPTRIPWLRVS